MKISNLDVMSEMSKRNMPEIKAATDITELRKVKAGTKVTFGIPFDCIGAIWSGEMFAVCVLIDKKKFFELKAEMEK